MVRGSADAFQFAFLQHAQQLGLERGGDLADLVEEYRAAFGLFEASLALRHRAGECAFLMAEQFAFQQRLRQGRAVEFDEAAARTRRVVMDGVGDQFLAGTGLAAYQHGGVPLRHQPHLFEDAAHGLGMADDIVEAVLPAHGAAQHIALFHDFFLFLRDFLRQAHALADQVADHFQEMLVFAELLGDAGGGLRREYADHFLADADRHTDKSALRVIDTHAAQEARLVHDALDHDAAAGLEYGADHAFTGQVADFFGDRIRYAVHQRYLQFSTCSVNQTDHAAFQRHAFMQRVQHAVQRFLEVERTRQYFAHLIQRVQFGTQQVEFMSGPSFYALI